MKTRYVIEHNIDDRVLNDSKQVIHQGKLLCFPTDSNWVVACTPFDKGAVNQLYALKNAQTTKHFSMLVSSIQMGTQVGNISDFAFNQIKALLPLNATFIIEVKHKLGKMLKASKMDKEIGLRFSTSKLVNNLLDFLEAPLMIAHITNEDLAIEQDHPLLSYQIEECLGHQLELIIDPGDIDFTGAGSIISLINDNLEIIRE